MSFDLEKFINLIYQEFQTELSISDIEEILDLKEIYNRDSPLSTGKRLLLTNISFTGQKEVDDHQDYSGQVINFSRKIEPGVNMWIADNFKGKSSIFKVIKYALTGNSSIKVNVKSWLHEVFLNFNISDKEYTIHLNLQNTKLVGQLVFGKFNNREEIKINEEKVIFKAETEKDYKAQIQDFFYKQFLYYTLKYTKSQKGKSSLTEVNIGWNTYYKSIFLESKDSNELMFGNTQNKIFQMLLGIEYTAPINYLTVKSEKLSSENSVKTEIKGGDRKQEVNNLRNQLNTITTQLEKLAHQTPDKSKIQKLYTEYNDIILKKGNINASLVDINNKIRDEINKKSMFELDKNESSATLRDIQKQLNKSRKQKNDLEEYLQIGIFFSNLDIKKCPSCSHTIDKKKQHEKVKEHKCAICDNDINEDILQTKKTSFEFKIRQLSQQIESLIKEEEALKNDLTKTKKDLEETTQSLSILNEKRQEYLSQTNFDSELQKVEDSIYKERQLFLIEDKQIEKLIGEKAVIEYRLKELIEKESLEDSKIKLKIKILEKAISLLVKMRFESSNLILEKLRKLMLVQVNKMGLTSISDIQITDKLDIQFHQGAKYVLFSKITEGEQLRAKLALYLSLIQLDAEMNFGHHTKCLIIDSPGKEEGDKKYIAGLSNILKEIHSDYKNELQIIVGTAERDLTDIVEQQIITPENEYIF
ncbi:hypothetical protein [Xanthocytophaga agilis]|uniref:Uncharacterized protein n=1 Tax=Xanthocytophaga agilis TaxID=3048010 RepID=A0AAE3R430_9BACT|nr:hypothetical protein [Xanthocytophaga agilis]MDJ1503501.1 hypothetical protein [Xanthocytophaga agilis]